MRVLAVKRISRDTETSDALAAQDERLTRAIGEGGHVAVGMVEDATVSGAINLDERPKLGQWMRSPRWEQWDAIMVTTLDRITRNQYHWEVFAERCHQAGKEIICLDDPALDIHTPTGRMIAYVKATQAQEYRAAIVTKRLIQVEQFRQHDLWPGGLWPFGYRALPFIYSDGKRRRRLFLDPVTSKLIREAYDRLVNRGHRLSEIARDWNMRDVLTAKDYQAHVNALEGRDEKMTEVKGYQWQHNNLKVVLSKPSLMGYAMHKGEIRMRDGLPVQWADPILTPEEFAKLQDVLNAKRGTVAKAISNPLRETIYCPCGEHMNSDSSDSKTGKRYHYMKCRTHSTYKKCRFRIGWPIEFVRTSVEASYMDLLGDQEITTKEFVPGKDNRPQIAQLTQAISNLSATLGSFEPGSVAWTQTVETMKRHEENLKKLEADPVVDAYWEVTGTGETYRDWWNREQDWYKRGELLRNSGIRIYFGGSPKSPCVPIVHTWIPEDLTARAGDVLSGTIEPGFAEEASEAAREVSLSEIRPQWDRFWSENKEAALAA
ncbi:recombinase family protein [Streptomyces sp. NPDC127068]|uniref:recombinase family protein n=1 Tax=Streptomyces sp. NPDC127068 TaxID=3347127 RepID=UPI003662DF43